MDTVATVLLPITTLLIGWILNQLRQGVVARRQHLSAIRKALTYLLEVRFQLQFFEAAITEVKRCVPDAKEHIPQFRTLIESMIGNEDHIIRKYDEAVDAVAASDPFLAYQLASRAKVARCFRAWRQWAASMGAGAGELENAESALKSLIGPKFDEVILSVARSVSIRTKWRARRILSQRFQFPQEVKNLLDKHRART